MILSSAFHSFQKLTKRIALSWVKRRHLQTTSHTSNSSLRWYGKVVIHIFYLRFLNTPSLRRLWIPFLSKRFHVYCGWQQGGLWMLESDWERRKLQQMILNKNLWVRNSTSFLAWFCSTAEDISDGGGKGEDQQFSISNNIFKLVSSNSSSNSSYEILPCCGTRSSSHCTSFYFKGEKAWKALIILI